MSSKLDSQLKKAQNDHEFYMASYLMDVMCASREYPTMGRKWDPSQLQSMFTTRFSGKISTRKIMKEFAMACSPTFIRCYLEKRPHAYLQKVRHLYKDMEVGI